MATKASAAKSSPGARPSRKLEPTLAALRREFRELANRERAASSAWFFRTGPGEYGEGDKFLGLTVPVQRGLSKRYSALPLESLAALLDSPFHEHRLTALFVLVEQYRRGGEQSRQSIFDFYVARRHAVNNWDLVDSSAPYIAGEHLVSRPRRILHQWVTSDSLWERRMAIVSTAAFIRRGDPEDTFTLAAKLLGDKQDLIHKAAGWMLREAGKRDELALRDFLHDNYPRLPRTLLRYAIELWPPERRKGALTGSF